MAISDTKLRSIHGKPYSGSPEITDSDGLGVRITPRGIINFQYRYRWQGKQHRIGIGKYPAVSLHDARNRVAELRLSLDKGIDPKAAAAHSKATTKPTVADTGKKNMVSHWFGSSQWQLPGEADYLKLKGLFTRIAIEKHRRAELARPHHQRVTTSQSLNRKYSDLLAEFKSLRRYFAVSASVPYTDVWMHKPVQFYPGKHPCEKPTVMFEQIINASSRPGDVVADFSMGSGPTLKAAVTLGRCAIGVELERERFLQTAEEMREYIETAVDIPRKLKE